MPIEKYLAEKELNLTATLDAKAAYVEKSMTELRNLTRQEWQTRLAGQMVSTGTELQVTSYDELRSFIQEELGELFEEDVQK